MTATPGEIEKAMLRLNARKEATGSKDPLGERVTQDAFLRSISGLDLDPEEIEHVKKAVEQQVREAVVVGGFELGLVGAGMFLDGLVIGLLVAEERERAGSEQ